MPKDKNNVPFYVKHGFIMMENGAAIQICTYGNAQSVQYHKEKSRLAAEIVSRDFSLMRERLFREWFG